MCGYDEISIRQFIQDRLDDEILDDCWNSENSADDDDEVDETMELNEQVDVMDLYHMMGTVTQ
jgi:hypothetical protein